MSAGKSILATLKSSLLLLPALRLVWQSSPPLTMARVVLIVVQGVLPLLPIYLTKLIIDAVTDQQAFGDIIPLLVGVGGVTLVMTLANSLTELVNEAHAQRVTDHMQGILHAKSIEADLEYYENADYYDTLQRAQQEAPYRPPKLLTRLAQAGQTAITLIAMIGFLLTLHWGVVGFLLVAAIPAALVRTLFARIIYRWQRRRTQLERKSMYLGWTLTSDLFAKEIRLFRLGKMFSERYQRLRRQLYQEKLAIATKRSIAFFTAQAFTSLFAIALLAFIVYRTLEGSIGVGDLVAYTQALQKGQSSLRSLLTSLSGLYEDNLFLANLYEFLDLQPKVVEPTEPHPMPNTWEQGIEYKQVSFQYGTTTRQALHDINFKVRPGEVIALVGENGSGKTTLIKLLCRLYDPSAGQITIDGIDLRDFTTADLRRQISVIFQDYAKYNFSAHDNIWLGNIDLPPDDDAIAAAAHLSGAADVIEQLPQKYQTILGKMFDHGEELSIGQWQKIALARAFLRQSQVIVLDEPTSAMDPKAEYEVFQQFRQLIHNQAAILISHRLSTVKMADHIYVMGNGSIIEHGSHDQLLELNGTYAYLFETQARNYQI